MTPLRSRVKLIPMKKLSLYVFLVLMFCSNSNSDHQVDHWVNLVCKYDDGSGNIEIKFDKKNK